MHFKAIPFFFVLLFLICLSLQEAIPRKTTTTIYNIFTRKPPSDTIRYVNKQKPKTDYLISKQFKILEKIVIRSEILIDIPASEGLAPSSHANTVMGNQTRPTNSVVPTPPPPPQTSLTLVQPSSKKKPHKPVKILRVFRNVFRSFPIVTPACRLPTLPGGRLPENKGASGPRICGTLFGYRKGRVSLSIQENPRTLPTLVVELAMQTHVLQKEMSAGMVRIALECEKRGDKDKTNLLDEPLWTMFCNGKKIGYGVKREATEEDLHVMEVLKAVSMGAAVLPGLSEVEGPDGEMAYMRAHFEKVVGSKDSVTLYMLSPDSGNNGPELSIFFVRV